MDSFLRRSLFLAALPALAALGCSGSDFTGTAVSASVPRDKHPSVTAGDAAALVTGNTDFAFAMYHGMSGADTTHNFFYSPYSVSLALSMTFAGAGGKTATQMATALDFTLPESRLAPAFDQLDLGIQAKPAGATGANGQPFAISVADSLWGDQRVSFQKPFLTTLATDYGAGLRTVDFVDQPAQAEDAINAWVANETDDKIDPLLGPGVITSDTEFVIVNAVYFNAGWGTAFQKSATHPAPFTRPDGSTVQASLMHGAAATAYAKGSSWQAVELPYSGGTTSMVIVLPDPGAYAAVEHGLGGSFFTEVTSALSSNFNISLAMPSFKIHGPTVSLVEPLQALGMTDAFDPKLASFTPMIGAGGVYIGDVLHQAFVDVDESGTEAAAATAVIGVGLAANTNPGVDVIANRAFFFFIRDQATNSVLFVGREADPTAE
jgi:serpin B